MTRCLVVTGTDTGVGKTRAACALLYAAAAAGIRAAGYKPVASGCEETPEGLRNDDALALLAASAPGLDYDRVNPLAYAPPVAPHLAAADLGRPISAPILDQGLAWLRERHELVVIEGAGGWQVPMSCEPGEPTWTFADWAAPQGAVVLVVGLRLGCLNHALLSAQSIRRGGRWAGWIANHLPEAGDRAAAMVETLSAMLGAPLLEIGQGQAALDAASGVPGELLRAD